MLCKRCEADKLESEFHLHKAYANGLSSWCRDCHRAANREWYAANKARHHAKAASWRKANPESAAEANKRYKRKNRDQIVEFNAAWTRANRDKRRASTARRKAALLKATPAWANVNAIERFYRLAGELQTLTGIPMHVDHIVPLQHPLVCGLHCEKNLQIVPARFNEAKKNYWWPNMFAPIRKAYAQPDMFVAAPKQEEPKQEAFL